MKLGRCREMVSQHVAAVRTPKRLRWPELLLVYSQVLRLNIRSCNHRVHIFGFAVVVFGRVRSRNLPLLPMIDLSLSIAGRKMLAYGRQITKSNTETGSAKTIQSRSWQTEKGSGRCRQAGAQADEKVDCFVARPEGADATKNAGQYTSR